jgi:hypothetical protein
MARLLRLAVLVLLAGCATTVSTPPAPPPSAPPAPVQTGDADLWAVYAAVVEAAKYPVPEHVFTGLTPILRSTEGLRWDSEGRVLMVTWTKTKYYEGRVGQPYPIPQGVYVWLTAVPYLQRACRDWGLPPERLSLRIAQSLGTPPPPATGGNDAFVQMWVDPRTFFRPCPDPEITDQECQVSLDGGPVDRSGGCPWSTDQLSAAFVQVSQAHLDWMCSNWKSTFTGDPKTSFPWTALGYTFDWGDLLHPVGQSEYVAPPGTTVWIESISTVAEYCHESPP